MWLYVPEISCLSAPGTAASTLDSESLIPLLEPSVTWKGKLLRPASWRRALKMAPLNRRLFGRIFEPSTAARGVARWISSLRAIPANRSASPASGSGAKILAISGRKSRALSAKSNPAKSSSKTSAGILSSASLRSRESFDAWAMTLRRDSLQRRKSARLIAASGCLSSQIWHTPHGLSGSDKSGKTAGGGGEFAKQAMHWPTPNVPNGGRSLSPADILAKGATAAGKRQVGLENVARNWPTARAEDAESCGNHPGATDSLTGAARLWRTPDAPTTGGVRTRSKSCGQGHQVVLAEQAIHWPTPAALSPKAAGHSVDLQDAVYAFSLPVPTTSTLGAPSSPNTRRLNPVFVECLMNLPPHWTDYTPLASIAYERWEMASSHLLRQWLTRYFGTNSDTDGRTRSNEKNEIMRAA